MIERKTLAGIIAIAFFAGTISVSAVGYAAGATPTTVLQAINNLANIIQNKQTAFTVNVPPPQVQVVNGNSPPALPVITSQTGFVNTGPIDLQILYYGTGPLCRISAGTQESVYLQFGNDTLVQNMNSSCFIDQLVGDAYLIHLHGNIDSVFHKGSILVLNRLPEGTVWDEVYRQTS